TGHLVLSTLHTRSAAGTVDRIIDSFPPHQQSQVRLQLAGVLQAVISQQLVPRADGKGRVLAVEVMITTPAIRNLIREGKTHQIDSVIETAARSGMQTMDASLRELFHRGLISSEEYELRRRSEGFRKRLPKNVRELSKVRAFSEKCSPLRELDVPAFVTRFPGDGCCGGHGGVEMAELFEYKAWDHTGKLVSGTMEAERPDEVASRLRVRGYFPSTVRPARPKQSLLQFSRRRKPGPRDLSVLCRQLAVMVETGIPLVTSLQLPASQQRHAALKEALEETRRDVSGGSSLTESLRKHDRIFPGLFLD